MSRVWVDVPNCVEVAHRYELHGIPCANVLWGEAKIPPITTAQIDLLAQQLAFYWNSAMRPLMTDQLSYVECSVREMTTETSYRTTYPLSGSSGLQTGGGLPGNNAFRLELLTGIPGRYARGHSSILGIPKSKQSGNLLDETWCAAIRTAWAGQLIQFDARGFRWSVVSRYVNGGPRTPPIVNRITAISFNNNTIDSMRKRLP